jgi:hypothetical protein
VAVAIIALPFVGVGEDLIRFAGFLEFGLGLLVAGVAIRMMLHGQLAIGTLDFFGIGALADAKDFIIVPFRVGHQGPVDCRL